MDEQQSHSAMARETAEIPEATERLLAQDRLFAKLCERIEQARPRVVVFCGRGSSGHAGVHMRYLFEGRLGILGSAAAPSIVTAYQRPPDLRGALWIVISQSGQSPDLVTATQEARRSGALTLAIVNVEQSPVAAASELVLPIGAGHEESVAATKTVAMSMIAGARLVAELASDDGLKQTLQGLSRRMIAALDCDWSAWSDRAASAPAAFVVARGYGLGPAREIALKLAETVGVPALGYSAAELRHGPRASINDKTPVLLLRQEDATAAAVDALARELKCGGGQTFIAGGMHGTLPWIGDGHSAMDPVLMLLPAYRAIEMAARRRGLNPDNPPHLNKITHTL